jgi:AraC-like DNA-binding protein
MTGRLDRVGDWPGLAKQADYSASKLADLCYMSLRQLERYMAGRFGKTPQRWFLELRCELARKLIEQGYSTKAASAELNFSSPAHFCHVFKKIYSVPPQTFSPRPDALQPRHCRKESIMSLRINQ